MQPTGHFMLSLRFTESLLQLFFSVDCYTVRYMNAMCAQLMEFWCEMFSMQNMLTGG